MKNSIFVFLPVAALGFGLACPSFADIPAPPTRTPSPDYQPGDDQGARDGDVFGPIPDDLVDRPNDSVDDDSPDGPLGPPEPGDDGLGGPKYPQSCIHRSQSDPLSRTHWFTTMRCRVTV